MVLLIFCPEEAKEISQFDDESGGRMVHFALQAIQSLCTIIYPKDPAALAFKCSKRMENGATKSDDSKLCENAKVVAMNLPPRSLQRRALLCLVASAYNSDILKTEFALGKQLIAESRKGFNFMANGNVLEKQIPRRLDLPPETEIYYCVFVLGAQIFKSRYNNGRSRSKQKKSRSPKRSLQRYVDV